MSEGIGLKPWERWAVVRVSYLGAISMCMATGFAWLVGPYWVVPAYGAGGAVAWAALRADGVSRARGGPGSALRRVLGRVAQWELRMAAVLGGFFASFHFIGEFMSVPMEPLKGLWDPEMTKAEVAAAFEEALSQVPAAVDGWIVATGIAGIAVALLSGLTDWMWLLALSRRRGMSPWRVLSSAWSRSHLREDTRRESARRRRLLGGEK